MAKQTDSTILDLAAMLQLSPATISRALNNHPYVKEHTRKLVLEAAEKIGYRRNVLASGLRSRKTGAIGMIVPRISMFFHAEVITAVQTELYKQGYNLVISQSNDDPVLEKQLVDTFYASRVEAVIVAFSLLTQDFTVFSKLTENGIPVLFYDRTPPGHFAAHIVKGDDFRGGYLAGQHLAETGCRNIALICGPETSNLYRDRKAGFLEAMSQAGIGIAGAHIVHQPLTHENARAAIERLLSERPLLDGVFSANDTSALAVLEFCREKRIPVPQQLKIVGYSNDPRSAIVSPSITTIEQFPARVGLKTATTLLELLRNPDQTNITYREVLMPVQLIRRMST